MKIRTKLLILNLVNGVFELATIAAAMVAVLLLYRVSVNEASVYYLILSIGTAFIAKSLSVYFDGKKEQVDYIDQLMKRGYTRIEARSAWKISINGGSSLLLNLRQADIVAHGSGVSIGESDHLF